MVNAQGRLLFEAQIEEAAASGWVLRAPSLRADSAEQLEQYFEQAMARGNEGLMIKDLQSPYMPGRRGRWWLKLKRELATLDVVVTAAEFGHGKRIHVLSDYTFAVRKGEELVNIGKAYSGLTDKEIAELTEWFLAHTTADHGHLREVEPKIVLEVAFNAIMRSDRHDSGFALRFPRIVRVRQDKLPEEIDTVEAGGADLQAAAWTVAISCQPSAIRYQIHDHTCGKSGGGVREVSRTPEQAAEKSRFVTHMPPAKSRLRTRKRA